MAVVAVAAVVLAAENTVVAWSELDFLVADTEGMAVLAEQLLADTVAEGRAELNFLVVADIVVAVATAGRSLADTVAVARPVARQEIDIVAVVARPEIEPALVEGKEVIAHR